MECMVILRKSIEIILDGNVTQNLRKTYKQIMVIVCEWLLRTNQVCEGSLKRKHLGKGKAIYLYQLNSQSNASKV